MKLWGVRLRFQNNRESVMVLGSRVQAEYYIALIPQLMIWDIDDVKGLISAKIVSVE